MEDEDWEENPFENRPIEKKDTEEEEEPKPSARPIPPPPEPDDENPFERISGTAGGFDDSPFENQPSSDAGDYGMDEDFVYLDEFDKSKLSLVSGAGFVALGLILVLFVFLPGDPLMIGLAIASLVFSILVAFFYMLDDLKIRISPLTERGARFISGIFLMILVIILLSPLIMYYLYSNEIDYMIPLTLIPIILLTHGSVALFLYSMLWEE